MSSSSESDEDFVPGEPEQLSEEESADDDTELQYEKEQEVKSQKRKTKQKPKATKKRKTRNNIKEAETKEESEEEEEKALDPEAEKKRQDELWAMFLDGTETKSKPKSQTVDNDAKTKDKSSKDNNEPKPRETNDLKDRERRIFEFAGETIVVENNVIKEKIPTALASEASKPLVSTSRKPGGGLSSVLGQLNKNNKLSTLEKSKLDWETYKQKEGIQEEIQSHNKGKNGYLDRQDFLQRADLRQYEIERDMRMSRRSNR